MDSFAPSGSGCHPVILKDSTQGSSPPQFIFPSPLPSHGLPLKSLGATSWGLHNIFVYFYHCNSILFDSHKLFRL